MIKDVHKMIIDGKDQSFEDWLRSKISENHELKFKAFISSQRKK